MKIKGTVTKNDYFCWSVDRGNNKFGYVFLF